MEIGYSDIFSANYTKIVGGKARIHGVQRHKLYSLLKQGLRSVANWWEAARRIIIVVKDYNERNKLR